VEEDDIELAALEPLARSLEGVLQVAGREALSRGHGLEVGAELGDDARSLLGQALAELLLHGALAIDVGRVEEGDAELEGAVDGPIFLGLDDRAVAVAREAPRAQREL
jgi:hypothetical protein